MGWNNVENCSSIMNGVEGQTYFVHSYYVPMTEETIAECDYGLTFSASLAKDNFFGCQFHPEKSGKVGESIIQNFLNQ